MRCYHLANSYLPGIHAGIQSAHTQHEMALKYLGGELGNDTLKTQHAVYVEWATNHKTVIVLNGGWQSTLQEWVAFLAQTGNPYPWAMFHEELDSLNGALTNVGVVVPEHIYSVGRELREMSRPGVASSVMLKDGRELQVRASATILLNEAKETIHTYTQFEVELAIRLSGPSLMG